MKHGTWLEERVSPKTSPNGTIRTSPVRPPGSRRLICGRASSHQHALLRRASTDRVAQAADQRTALGIQ